MAELGLTEPGPNLSGGDSRGQAEAADGHAGSESLDFLKPSSSPGRIGKLGSYEVLEVTGYGGMGIVLKAHDTKLNRIVAIKVLAPHLSRNAAATKRFLREAQAAAAVSHERVVTIFAVEESSLPPYLVMEFIEGQSLQQKIDRCGMLGLAEILRIGMQIASGLAAAHKQGLVHRDIKPANILLENGVERVKITDFGLRAVDDVAITQTGQIAGTPQYMSPEQAASRAGSRSDLFSLGSVLYTMCTGRPAFRADSAVAVLRRVCDDQPRPIQEINPEMPGWLCAVIEKLMAKRPEERYQSAAEVAELLNHYLAWVQQQPRAAAGRRAPVAGASQRPPNDSPLRGNCWHSRGRAMPGPGRDGGSRQLHPPPSRLGVDGYRYGGIACTVDAACSSRQRGRALWSAYRHRSFRCDGGSSTTGDLGAASRSARRVHG